ncbi:MAG: hypothetical protein WCB51_04275 [Candidatus Dormiibacterota bacterium]
MKLPLTLIAIAGAVVLLVLIGAAVGILRARRSNAFMLRSIHETRSEERRAAAYLETALGWHAYLETLRPLAFPEEGLAVHRPRDLAIVLRSRAQLELFGSTAVQRLHEEALDESVTLIDLLRSMPRAPATGDVDIAAGRVVLRFVLKEVSKRVNALERQMNSELQARTAIAEGSIEIPGRRQGHAEGSENGNNRSDLAATVPVLRS